MLREAVMGNSLAVRRCSVRSQGIYRAGALRAKKGTFRNTRVAPLDAKIKFKLQRSLVTKNS